MEKDSKSWFHHLLSPGLNLSGFPLDTGHLNTNPVSRNPHYVEDPIFRTVPSFPVSGLQQSKANEQNHSQNWFYNMPNFNQTSASKEKFHASPFVFGQEKSPITDTPPSQKRFIVFDQSGDKTTLIYSQTPAERENPWLPKPPQDVIHPLMPIFNEDNILDNSRDFTEDEMHEDTEELNALLYSDSEDDFSEDDEETSTGHSPSTMTDNGVRNLAEEKGEEVDSFAGPTKRLKLSDGSSLKKNCGSSSVLEDDDAGSSCGNNNNYQETKKSRREKIWETVSILQSIIPGVSGKDGMVVIDEAIHYLRSLKDEAKALGLDSL